MGSLLQKMLAGMVAVGATVGLTVAPVPAHASTTLPAAPETCSPGQPKLDYQYFVSYSSEPWSNVCGTGTWVWNTAYAMMNIRMPTTPYHRVWFHEFADGSGWADCFYSEDVDMGTWLRDEEPGNIQVSANTAPC